MRLEKYSIYSPFQHTETSIPTRVKLLLQQMDLKMT